MTNRDEALSHLSTARWELMGGSGAVLGYAEEGDYREAFDELAKLEKVAASLQSAVLELMRADGLTWQEIGVELGVTRQAAQKRYRLAAA